MFVRNSLIIFLLALFPVQGYAQNFDQIMDEVWDKYDSAPLECIELLDQALNIALDTDDIQRELEVKETKGIVFDELGFGNKAVEIYLDVLKERERLGDKQELISLNLNLGIVHSNINNSDQALDHYEAALLLAKEFDDEEGELFALNNLGTQLSKAGRFKESIACFRSIIEKDSLTSDHYCSAFTNLGLAYRRSENNPKALEQFRLGAPFVPDKRGTILLTYKINLGISQVLAGLLDKGETNLLEAHEMAADIGNMQLESNVCIELSKLYEAKSNDYKALHWLNKHLELKNRLTEIRNQKYVSTLSTVYEVEQKEDEIAALEVEKSQRTFRLWTISAIAAILLLALLLVWFVFRSRLKDRQQAEKIQQLQLDNQEADIRKYKSELEIKTKNLLDRNRLVQEINDELSSLKSSNNNPVVKELLKTKILTNQDWENYKRSFNLVHVGFFEALTKKAPDLTQGEQRTSALCRLQLSNIEIAEILGISERSVIQNKYRLRKKMDLSDNDELEMFLGTLS